MITKIDNSQKVFLIQQYGWASDKIFCNLKDIQKCMKQMGEGEPYHISEFYNRKFNRISKKRLIEYLKANQIKVTI